MSVRLAIIGAGHLGRIHAKLAGQADGCQLQAIVDPSAEAREQAASGLEVQAAADWQPLADTFDAAIVAAPTHLHHSLGMKLLTAGKHVLMEKPLASTPQQAAQLVAVAAARQRVLQVGHVERFNPALHAARQHVAEVGFIEAVRQSPYSGRCIDVGVVLDLMIHDIDVALTMIDSPVRQVSATGAVVVGPHEDLARAWVEFANGAVATFSASRVSTVAQRTMRIISQYSEANIDFNQRRTTLCRPSLTLAGQAVSGRPPAASLAAAVQQRHLTTRELPIRANVNPLAEEQADFVSAIRNGHAPQVTATAGHAAMVVADQVLQAVQQHIDQRRHSPAIRRAA